LALFRAVWRIWNTRD